VILCGNTTQALDLAAHVMAHREGVTLVSLMEHHSNDLPHRSRGKVVHFGVKDDGTLDYDDLEAKLRQLTGEAGGGHRRLQRHRLPARRPPDRAPGARARRAHPDRRRADPGARARRRAARLDPGHLDFFAGAGHKATRLSARRSCSGRSSSSTRRLPTSPRAAPSST
jgi:hypothetical protein